MENTRLGFIGVGLMGSLMIKRLLAADYQVTLWNRTRAKAEKLVDAGATLAATIGELVDQVDVVMLCLSDTEAVRQTVFGEQGISRFGSNDKVLVDFSSIDPLATQDFAQQLSQACGMEWIDAPVSGGTVGAADGSLIIMAGGKQEIIEKLRPVLDPLCRRLTHMGSVGSGQMTKVCNQMVVACNALVIAEMMALGRAAGVDVAKLPAALADGFADSTPFRILAPQMAQHDFELKWKVATLLKDLDGAVTLSSKLARDTPMSSEGVELLKRHAQEGHGDDDLSSIILLYEQLSNHH